MTLDKVLKDLVPPKEPTWNFKCPACAQGWNRGCPCVWFEGSKRNVDYLCVLCAESVFGIAWLQSKRPIAGCTFTISYPPALIPWHDCTRKSAQMNFSYGGMTFFLFGKADRILMRRDKSEEPTSFQNAFQAFYAIKNILETGDVFPEKDFPSIIR